MVQSGSLIEILRFRAHYQAERYAYIFLRDGESEGGSLDYAALDQRARIIAGWLQSWCSKGKRALLIYSDPLEFISAFFGCLYAGVLAVPTQPPTRSRTSRRISSITSDAQPVVILTTADLVPKLEQQCRQISELTNLPIQTTETIPAEFAADWRDPQIVPDELAFLQYTSGSTASPKGVMITHGNLMHNLAHIQAAWENTSECVNGTWLPAFHDMGLIEGILQPMYCGYPSVIMPSISFLQRPVRWLRMITKYKVTNSGGPNSAFDLCVQKIKPEQCESLDLSSWSFCYNGSEPVRKRTLEQFFQAFQPYGLRWESIHPGYGLAEATLLVSGGRRLHEPLFCTVRKESLSRNDFEPAQPGESGACTLVSSGPIHPDYFDVVIVDPETMKECDQGKIGEIWLKGPSVAKGYWDQPEKTSSTFHAYESESGRGPFLRTGDLGFIRDGELFVTGRLKDVIISAGRNHYPQDIELTAENAHSAIRSGCGAAFCVDDGTEERLVIVCEVDRINLRSFDFEGIVGAVRQAVAEEHEISVWEVYLIRTGSIPKTSSGKIQRQICKERLLAGELEILKGLSPSAGNPMNPV